MLVMDLIMEKFLMGFALEMKMEWDFKIIQVKLNIFRNLKLYLS